MNYSPTAPPPRIRITHRLAINTCLITLLVVMLTHRVCHGGLVITLDFSNFGSGGAWANLRNDAWTGSTSDATKQSAAQAVMQTAASYWEAALSPCSNMISQTIAVNWQDLSGNTLATGGTGWFNDAPNYTLTGGVLNWDTTGSLFFVDTTPGDQSEFAASSQRSTVLGTVNTNVENVFYHGSGASSDHVDFLTVAIHEIGHALGFLGSYPKYANLDVGSDGDLDLSNGAEISYSGGHHTNTLSNPPGGFPDPGTSVSTYYPTVMGPSLVRGARKLLTAADILTVANIHGCTNPNLSAVPEANSFAVVGVLVMLGLAGKGVSQAAARFSRR